MMGVKDGRGRGRGSTSGVLALRPGRGRGMRWGIWRVGKRSELV